MVDANEFRRIALGLKDAVEGRHMGHPDFRIHHRIFATLHADMKSGMVKLTPDQQQRFVADDPTAFAPESGAWGRSGCTRVNLYGVDPDALGQAMTLAWQNVASKAGKPSRAARSRR